MKFSLTVKMPDDASTEVIEQMTKDGVRECHRQAADKALVIISLTCTSAVDITVKDAPIQVMKLDVIAEPAPYVIIITDTKIPTLDAVAYARTVWPEYKGEVTVVSKLQHMDKLYGRTGIPYVMYPGTVNLVCRSWLPYHEKAGRTIQVHPHKSSQTAQMTEPLAEA